MKQIKRFPSLFYDIPFNEIKHIYIKHDIMVLINSHLGAPVGRDMFSYYWKGNSYVVLSTFDGVTFTLDYLDEEDKNNVLKILEDISKGASK